MNGDKKQQGKGLELLYRASLDKSFMEKVQVTRKKNNLPISGLKSTREASLWAKSNPDSLLLYEALRIATDYSLPPISIIMIRDFIIYGDNKKWSKYEEKKEPFFVIDPNNKHRYGMDDLLKKSEIPYAVIMIPDYTSKNEAKEYISKAWNDIQKVMESQRKGPKKRIRKTVYKDRNKEVTKMMKNKPKDKPKHLDSHTYIKRKLAEKNVHVSLEQIRSIPSKKYNGPRNK